MWAYNWANDTMVGQWHAESVGRKGDGTPKNVSPPNIREGIMVNREKSDILALEMYDQGIPYGVSSFEDWITYGYGDLNIYGFWQYTLVVEA